MKEENNRFTLRNSGGRNWVLRDSETTINLTFEEGKVKTEGFFFNQEIVSTDCKLIGDTIRQMSDYLDEHYKNLTDGK